MDECQDSQLMLQVRNGDIDKMTDLFIRYQKRLYNYFLLLTGNGGLSEDLVQEVFFRILKFRHTFRGNGEFKAWIFRIARNAHIDHYRKSKRHDTFSYENIQLTNQEPNQQETLERNQELFLLREALNQLPVRQHELLALSRFENMKYKEIAHIYKCPIGTIKVRIHRALKELTKIYTTLAGES